MRVWRPRTFGFKRTKLKRCPHFTRADAAVQDRQFIIKAAGHPSRAAAPAFTLDICPQRATVRPMTASPATASPDLAAPDLATPDLATDVVIAGGGMAGMSMALALASAGITSTVVDPVPAGKIGRAHV